MTWYRAYEIGAKRYCCGYCGSFVSSSFGVRSNKGTEYVYICPDCERPSYWDGVSMSPGSRPCREVKSLPREIESAYNEARTCHAHGCYTAATFVCRVLLLHVAKDRGISAGNQSPSFQACVDFLIAEGHIASKDKDWVDSIRVLGNEANHELKDVSASESMAVLQYIEHLLLANYDYRPSADLA